MSHWFLRLTDIFVFTDTLYIPNRVGGSRIITAGLLHLLVRMSTCVGLLWIDVSILNINIWYTSQELLCLKQNQYMFKDAYDCWGNADLLRPKQCIHQSSECNYIPSSSSLIPVLNSQSLIADGRTKDFHSCVVFSNLLSPACSGRNSCAAVTTSLLNAVLFSVHSVSLWNLAQTGQWSPI